MTVGRSNSFNPEMAKIFIDRAETLAAEIAFEQEQCAERVKELRADIAAVVEEAIDAGIPKVPLKAALKARELERKADALRLALPPDAQDTYDSIRHALGDLGETPLGVAALARAESAMHDA